MFPAKSNWFSLQKSGNSNIRGRLCTVDLFVLTSLDYPFLILQTLFTFYKIATVMSLPLQLVFPVKSNWFSLQKAGNSYIRGRLCTADLFVLTSLHYPFWYCKQGLLKREVSLYCWPPVWLVWNQLYDNWQFLFLFEKQTSPNQSNRRSMVQWYIPLKYSLLQTLFTFLQNCYLNEEVNRTEPSL